MKVNIYIYLPNARHTNLSPENLAARAVVSHYLAVCNPHFGDGYMAKPAVLGGTNIFYLSF